MDITKYFNEINKDSQEVFRRSIEKKDALGSLHHLSSCIYEFSSCVLDAHERNILETVSSQLESSSYNLVLGLYRQAFSSLRLALEMGLAAIYFSVRKLEFHEWLDGKIDIKWSNLVDEENGVLSKRFARAFYSEMEEEVSNYRNNSKYFYRKLSEYVHGNNETWKNNDVKLNYNDDLFLKYCEAHENVSKIILFSAMCRYVRYIDSENLDSFQFLQEEFSHIAEIRQLFGRS